MEVSGSDPGNLFSSLTAVLLHLHSRLHYVWTAKYDGLIPHPDLGMKKYSFEVYFNAPGIHMTKVMSRESPVENSFHGVCCTSRYDRFTAFVRNISNFQAVKVSSVRSKSFFFGGGGLRISWESPKSLFMCTLQKWKEKIIYIPICVLSHYYSLYKVRLQICIRRYMTCDVFARPVM